MSLIEVTYKAPKRRKTSENRHFGSVRRADVYVHRVKKVVFSVFGGLGGNFYKDTYEPKLFGMHICVLSGWNAKNANTDLKMSILPIRQMGNVYVHRVKRVFFSTFGPLGGDF